MSRILGAHPTTPERTYSVARNSGLFTISGTGIFGLTIVWVPEIISTPAWAPLREVGMTPIVLGTVLLLSAILGVAGLAFEDNDVHKFPRMLTLCSAILGMAFFTTAGTAFAWSWYFQGWENSGPFLAAPAALMHFNRFWLLMDWPS